jgi:phage protein D
VVNIPFLSNSAPAAVRRPAFAIAHSSGAASGLGGLAAAAGDLLSQGGDDFWLSHTLEIAVQTGRLPFVNTACITFAAADAPDIALQDAITVSLGYGDAEPEAVLTGTVTRQVRTLAGLTHLHLSDGGGRLARQRLNQSYESQSAGDIVRDLADQSGVETDVVEDGISLPFFALASTTPAHAQIAALARRSGYWAYLTPEGKLTFAPVTEGDTVQTFTYGTDVLKLEMTDAAPALEEVQVSGEGAAGSQGQAAWNWLVADATGVQAQAGSGDAQRWVSDGALHSQEAVRTAATARAAAAASSALTGELWVPGVPQVVVGSQIAIAAAPNDGLNGNYQVERVCHRLSKARGFVTRLTILKPASVPLGALASLAGGLL